MKTVLNSLALKVKNLNSDINHNLKDIKEHNFQIQDLAERNEHNQIAIDECLDALSILDSDYKIEDASYRMETE